jgi:hypothetical protein
MKKHRVRRLPVLDQQGTARRIISMNDRVMRADCRKGPMSLERNSWKRSGQSVRIPPKRSPRDASIGQGANRVQLA